MSEPMDLSSRFALNVLFKQYHLRPQKTMGQHFLLDRATIERVIAAACLEKGDQVLEIGAGLGTLTVALSPRVSRVWAIEKDRKLVPVLRQVAKHDSHIAIVPGDIFRVWPLIRHRFQEKEFKIVANLPFNITLQFLRQFLEQSPKPSAMTLIVQKEVAERVVAKPGAMSILSVSVQFYAHPRLIAVIPREYFWPPPEVDSALLQIEAIQSFSSERAPEIKNFFRLVKIGFSSRRKQLQNNLAAGFRLSHHETEGILSQCGLNSRIRAQELSVSDWSSLVKKFRFPDLTHS